MSGIDRLLQFVVSEASDRRVLSLVVRLPEAPAADATLSA